MRATALALAALVACGRRTDPPRPVPTPAADAAASGERLPATNDGVNAEAALDAEIAQLEARRAARGDDWLFTGPKLVARLGQRAEARASTADRLRALALAEAWVEAGGGAGALAARGVARAALHELPRAREDLAAAAAGGQDVRVARAGVVLALGDWAEVEALLAGDATPGGLVILAGLRAEQGRLDEADGLFRRAARGLTSTSAHAMASLLFQHGVVLERGGRLAEARARFALARARLPGHVPAALHEAALALLEGDASGALARLDGVEARTDDAEGLALRAEALARLGRADEAARALGEAKGRVEGLLFDAPSSASLHAARFFAGVGADVDRARALAAYAWETTRMPEAGALVIRLALDRGDVATACRAVREAAPLPDGETLRAPRARAVAACPPAR